MAALVNLFYYIYLIWIVPTTAALDTPPQIKPYRIPGEYEPHALTYMSWPAHTVLPFWAGTMENVQHVKHEITSLSGAISMFEPVVMFVDPPQEEEAVHALRNFPNITITLRPVNDIWTRDYLPVFGISEDSNSLVGFDTNYNPPYGVNVQDDAGLAEWLLRNNSVPKVLTPFHTEGGALEFDGEGTLLVTQSSIFNPNRNPGFRSRDELETALKNVFQVKKVIWFPGKYNTSDYTDIHVDTLARFVKPGVVLLSLPPKGNPGASVCPECAPEAEEILLRERDAAGRRFQIVKIHSADIEKVPPTTGWPQIMAEDKFLDLFPYVNFYIVNDAVILPQFGDVDADRNARDVMVGLFPDRTVVPVNLLYTAHGGGNGHCATKHQPKVGWQRERFN